MLLAPDVECSWVEQGVGHRSAALLSQQSASRSSQCFPTEFRMSLVREVVSYGWVCVVVSCWVCRGEGVWAGDIDILKALVLECLPIEDRHYWWVVQIQPTLMLYYMDYPYPL